MFKFFQNDCCSLLWPVIPMTANDTTEPFNCIVRMKILVPVAIFRILTLTALTLCTLSIHTNWCSSNPLPLPLYCLLSLTELSISELWQYYSDKFSAIGC